MINSKQSRIILKRRFQVSLKKAIESIFRKAYLGNDGKDWREAIELFTNTQVNYESDIRLLKSGIIHDVNYRSNWIEFSESVDNKIKKGPNGELIADHEIKLIAIIAYCNDLSRRDLASVFNDRFGFSLCSSFSS